MWLIVMKPFHMTGDVSGLLPTQVAGVLQWQLVMHSLHMKFHILRIFRFEVAELAL